ncbi:MAG: hypothetical protein ABJL72_01590 [Roseobacter sp.]
MNINLVFQDVSTDDKRKIRLWILAMFGSVMNKCLPLIFVFSFAVLSSCLGSELEDIKKKSAGLGGLENGTFDAGLNYSHCISQSFARISQERVNEYLFPSYEKKIYLDACQRQKLKFINEAVKMLKSPPYKKEIQKAKMLSEELSKRIEDRTFSTLYDSAQP